jgi:hypothetical protein
VGGTGLAHDNSNTMEMGMAPAIPSAAP